MLREFQFGLYRLRFVFLASSIYTFAILNHKKNAYLVKADSPEAIVSAINNIKRDKNLSMQIAQQAWQDVQSLTWEHRAKDILNYFEVDSR